MGGRQKVLSANTLHPFPPHRAQNLPLWRPRCDGRTEFRLSRKNSADTFDVHFTWRNSVCASIKEDTFPSGGLNNCAVDVRLVMGRLMRVGLDNYDSIPFTDSATLPKISRLYRATIARTWHRLDVLSFRMALADLTCADDETDRMGGWTWARVRHRDSRR